MKKLLLSLLFISSPLLAGLMPKHELFQIFVKDNQQSWNRVYTVNFNGTGGFKIPEALQVTKRSPTNISTICAEGMQCRAHINLVTCQSMSSCQTKYNICEFSFNSNFELSEGFCSSSKHSIDIKHSPSDDNVTITYNR